MRVNFSDLWTLRFRVQELRHTVYLQIDMDGFISSSQTREEWDNICSLISTCERLGAFYFHYMPLRPSRVPIPFVLVQKLVGALPTDLEYLRWSVHEDWRELTEGILHILLKADALHALDLSQTLFLLPTGQNNLVEGKTVQSAHLTHLKVTFLDSVPFGDLHVRWHMPNLRHLTCLAVHEGDFAGLYTQLSSVEYFQLDSCTFNLDSSEAGALERVFPQLRHLCYRIDLFKPTLTNVWDVGTTHLTIRMLTIFLDSYRQVLRESPPRELCARLTAHLLAIPCPGLPALKVVEAHCLSRIYFQSVEEVYSHLSDATAYFQSRSIELQLK